MISTRSILTFTYVNLFLSGSSILMYHVMTLYHSFLIKSMFMFAKNAMFVFGLDYMADFRNKTQYPTHVTNQSPVQFESMAYLAAASVMETFSFLSIASICNVVDIPAGIVQTCIVFIPISFVVELVFDFFHYWAHRILHTCSVLYTIHKKHHSIHSLSGIVTFYQDPLDYLLTNYIPMIGSLVITKYFLNIEIHLLLYSFLVMYKEFIEIAGHVDILKSRSFSFPQFIWLPLLFGIEMTQIVHHNHHLYLNCNYSKRFCIWDKAFGTYRK